MDSSPSPSLNGSVISSVPGCRISDGMGDPRYDVNDLGIRLVAQLLRGALYRATDLQGTCGK
jgi:hypothetical protein